MKIRVKDLMEISTTFMYNSVILDCGPDEEIHYFDTLNIHDMKELDKCTYPVEQFWIEDGDMVILVK